MHLRFSNGLVNINVNYTNEHLNGFFLQLHLLGWIEDTKEADVGGVYISYIKEDWLIDVLKITNSDKHLNLILYKKDKEGDWTDIYEHGECITNKELYTLFLENVIELTGTDNGTKR